MEITITEQKRRIRDENGNDIIESQVEGKIIYKEEIINLIIAHPDHKGKIRYHNEDELRSMCLNLNEVIEELDKK